MNRNIKKLLSIILLCFIVLSCAPTKRAAYFRKNQKINQLDKPEQVYNIVKDSSNIIHTGDELYINVTSGNNEQNSFSQTSSSATTGTEFLSYSVDKEGYIRIPYLKKVKVAGMSVSDLTNQLESELAQFIYLPTVSIRIINSRFAILGEVNSPGMFEFNRNTLNIYQAIAMAGDIAPFGNRKKVLIVRQQGTQIVKKHLDLTNDVVMDSPWFMVQPEDIIYVEPLGRKIWGIETFPYELVMTLITLPVLVLSVVQTLKNNSTAQ
jgi:polysaccharide export outer membrane protein